ncbi:MAG: hypothetical protein IPN86_06430 [Saprospiraceae bacterium]|jgi:hypothetical protein|nr:hypothetical protein [Saprospiraceae bacterium]
MKFLNSILIFSTFLFLTFTSCKKEDDQPKQGEVTIEFDHVWGSAEGEFSLNKELTHPMLGEKMTFTLFKYYVSNVRLKAKDGSWYTMPESYFIVDADASGSNKVVVPNVPGGEYTDVEMMFGVDSLRNASGAQTGALDPAKGMFWSWNSGYIMVKAEGTAPTSTDGTFAFHLGGFKGENKVQTVKSYNFGTTALVVDGEREAEIHMLANPARLWHGAEKLAVKSKNHMPNALAKSMTTNFYDVVRFDHIHN